MDPDLVDITWYDKFWLDFFWGLERIATSWAQDLWEIANCFVFTDLFVELPVDEENFVWHDLVLALEFVARSMLAWLGIPIFTSDFWDPHRKQNSNSVFDSKDSGWNYFWNSGVWRVRKLEFRFAIFRILVICLCKNSLRLIVANLYWLQAYTMI